MHKVINPKILYFGTPVVLVSTRNADGSNNLAPISSVWWMGQSCMVGMSGNSKTVENLLIEKECVLNLPSVELVEKVDRLALLTGKTPIPQYKKDMGYQFEKNKFEIAGFTKQPSREVNAPRVKECPVQLEAVVKNVYSFEQPSAMKAIEMNIVKAHIESSLLTDDGKNHIDSDKWKPLIMSFCEFYGLGEKVFPSTLAKPFTEQANR
ncbi:flavin reductase family protein [Bacillus sp. 2205SS5-2]|uniref:flavin reductase family protein n=1 Tax=Bacillus sp. 2205SS5-2 TaxID=3109031 RepID=UPI0030049CF5